MGQSMSIFEKPELYIFGFKVCLYTSSPAHSVCGDIDMGQSMATFFAIACRLYTFYTHEVSYFF